MRVFVGIDIPPLVRERVSNYANELRKSVHDAKWVRPESLHITLKFIGEVEQARIADIQKALATVGGHPFEVRFRGVGFFPKATAPRVFWVGIESGPDLQALATAVNGALAQLVDPETEKFKPHLTLARSGSGRPQGSPKDRTKPKLHGLAAQVEGREPPDFGTMTASEFHLYESKLSRGGAEYKKVFTFPLT
jgi:RNA 2',3'-cyclic 3'-phosphodiesterase